MKDCRIHGNPNRNYAEEWKGWRKDHRMTQKQLGAAIGASWRTIWNIENGVTTPNITSRKKFQELQNRYQEAQEI